MNTQQLWQAQALDAPRISLAFVRCQSDALKRRTQLGKAANYIVGIPGTTYLVWKCAESFGVAPLLSAATALWAAASLVCYFLQRGFSAPQVQPAEFGVLDALRFYRGQLALERDACRSGRWLPLLFIPGHFMLFASFVIELTPIPWRAITVDAVAIVSVSWIAILMAGRRARRIQEEIDALDSL